MRETDEWSMAHRWPCIILLIAAATTAILAFGVWSGHCVDTAVESSSASTCVSGPTIGWTGAWIILALCVALIAVSIPRLMRRRSPRRQSYRTR